MKAILVVGLLLVGLMLVPIASAGPSPPPPCHDRGPVVDAGVVQVWLTRSCQPRVVFHEPSCYVGDLYICP